jgi:putative transcriptional regulator
MDQAKFSKAVGHRIAILRNKKGFTQRELSKLANVSRERISNFENGKAIPSSYSLYKIAETLDVSLDTLCGSLD